MMTLGYKCRTRAAPPCDIFNLGFIIFQCPLTIVYHLYIALLQDDTYWRTVRKKRLKVLSSNLPVTHGFNISIATKHQHEAGAFVRTSMMDLPAVGPKFSGPACRAAAAIDRYLQSGRARPQQQTHRPPLLLSIDGTDIRTNGRTDT